MTHMVAMAEYRQNRARELSDLYGRLNTCVAHGAPWMVEYLANAAYDARQTVADVDYELAQLISG